MYVQEGYADVYHQRESEIYFKSERSKKNAPILFNVDGNVILFILRKKKYSQLTIAMRMDIANIVHNQTLNQQLK